MIIFLLITIKNWGFKKEHAYKTAVQLIIIGAIFVGMTSIVDYQVNKKAINYIINSNESTINEKQIEDIASSEAIQKLKKIRDDNNDINSIEIRAYTDDIFMIYIKKENMSNNTKLIIFFNNSFNIGGELNIYFIENLKYYYIKE
jgi:hypothetical protein